MKIVRYRKKNPRKGIVNEKLISKFGQALYLCKEVKGVDITVKLRDGLTIQFEKDENDDSFEDFAEREGIDKKDSSDED